MRCYRLLLGMALFGMVSLVFSLWSTHAVVTEFENAVEATRIDLGANAAERLAQREHVVHQWALAEYLVSGLSILVLFGLVIRAYLVMETELRQAERPHVVNPKSEVQKAA